MAREVMNEPERYEQLIAFLDNNLPSPVERQELADGSMRFTGGDPQEVIAELTDSSVIVSAFGAVWETPYSMLAALTALIRGAREARAASFRICERCGRKTAPEWLDTDTVCHACARQEHVH
jgi:hypothetical protein